MVPQSKYIIHEERQKNVKTGKISVLYWIW